MSEARYIIGIDEVGRGPLAGPVGVGVAYVPVDFNWAVLPGVTDSKQLSESRREEIAAAARRLKAAGQLHFEVSMVSAPVIDRIGIVSAINLAINRALKRVETKLQITAVNCSNQPYQNLSVERENWFSVCTVKLDGGLGAPGCYQQQETIIKGDATVPEIGLASIVAKVARDGYMRRLAKRAAYTPYQFDTHKGYGTKLHRAAIAEHGVSNQHRQSYCRNIKLL
mgnify:CR=1 FL=1